MKWEVIMIKTAQSLIQQWKVNCIDLQLHCTQCKYKCKYVYNMSLTEFDNISQNISSGKKVTAPSQRETRQHLLKDVQFIQST